MITEEVKKINLKNVNLLNDAMFKSLFRSESAREIVVNFLSGITNIPKGKLERAQYIGGEIPKSIISEKGKVADVIVKISEMNQIIVEMNQYESDHIFEKNIGYVFGIINEGIASKKNIKKETILINIDGFNKFQVKDVINEFKIRDKYGNVESEIYTSYHVVLENIKNEDYNVSKEVKEFLEFLQIRNIEEAKEKYKGRSDYMAAIRKVEELSTDPEFIGYYDLEEAHELDIEDAELTGIRKGKQEGIQEGIQEEKKIIAKNMVEDNVPIEQIMKYTSLSEDEINNLKS